MDQDFIYYSQRQKKLVADYKPPVGCARICIGNMPLYAAQIRRSKRQSKENFGVYYKYHIGQYRKRPPGEYPLAVFCQDSQYVKSVFAMS